MISTGENGSGPNGGDTFLILGLMILALGWLVGAWVTYQLSDTTGESPISIEYVVPEKSSRLLALCSIPLIPLIGYLKMLFLLPHIIILFFFIILGSGLIIEHSFFPSSINYILSLFPISMIVQAMQSYLYSGFIDWSLTIFPILLSLGWILINAMLLRKKLRQ